MYRILPTGAPSNCRRQCLHFAYKVARCKTFDYLCIGIYAVEIIPFPPSYGNRRKMYSSAAIIRSYRVAEVKTCLFLRG